MEKHLKALVNDIGEKPAVLQMRGHILNYLMGIPNNKEIKAQICGAKKEQDIINILESYRLKLKNLESVEL